MKSLQKCIIAAVLLSCALPCAGAGRALVVEVKDHVYGAEAERIEAALERARKEG